MNKQNNFRPARVASISKETFYQNDRAFLSKSISNHLPCATRPPGSRRSRERTRLGNCRAVSQDGEKGGRDWPEISGNFRGQFVGFVRAKPRTASRTPLFRKRSRVTLELFVGSFAKALWIPFVLRLRFIEELFQRWAWTRITDDPLPLGVPTDLRQDRWKPCYQFLPISPGKAFDRCCNLVDCAHTKRISSNPLPNKRDLATRKLTPGAPRASIPWTRCGMNKENKTKTPLIPKGPCPPLKNEVQWIPVGLFAPCHLSRLQSARPSADASQSLSRQPVLMRLRPFRPRSYHRWAFSFNQVLRNRGEQVTIHNLQVPTFLSRGYLRFQSGIVKKYPAVQQAPIISPEILNSCIVSPPLHRLFDIMSSVFHPMQAFKPVRLLIARPKLNSKKIHGVPLH
jgi:hypothetical protein